MAVETSKHEIETTGDKSAYCGEDTRCQVSREDSATHKGCLVVHGVKDVTYRAWGSRKEREKSVEANT